MSRSIRGCSNLLFSHPIPGGPCEHETPAWRDKHVFAHETCTTGPETVKGGCYEFTATTEQLDISVCFDNLNGFLSILIAVAPMEPFDLLIIHDDQIYGPAVGMLLADAFGEYRVQIEEAIAKFDTTLLKLLLGEDTTEGAVKYFFSLYDNFTKIFRLASQNGLVKMG